MNEEAYKDAMFFRDGSSRTTDNKSINNITEIPYSAGSIAVDIPLNRYIEFPSIQLGAGLLAGAKIITGIGVGLFIIAGSTAYTITAEDEEALLKESKAAREAKGRNKPKEQGEPNSIDVQRDAQGNVEKYTEYGPDGEFVKEVRYHGKDHGNIPRPNVKEPNYNVNPNTGEKFHNGYRVRPAEPWELDIK